ncbi:ABC transporter substrate-binding protein [Rhizobium leguminosarum]|uniref:ABC transporter substrate-binding protein n=1 Tax=Rhizobium leguminosarum TaxID=384 RepID=UPI001C93ECFD|nr:ABC transporter substrate-binding protein [Rhizobium leguminosarum]MBY5377291.1 ABC transporter substrate-binding protein [Rhizobium leguminosarum]
MNKLLSTLVFTLGLATADASAFAQDPIKIGYIGDFTGVAGALAEDQYQGFQLFLDQHDGKLGGYSVQILKEDSQWKPEVASQLVEKLIEKDKVPIITGITGSNIMMAVHGPITEKKVFLISSGAGPSPVAGKNCSPYAFYTARQANQISEVVGRYASGKYKNVMILAANYQAGKDVAAGFKRTFDGTIIEENYTALTQPDFSAEISQIQVAAPDAVFVFFPPALGINFARQYYQAGLTSTIPLLTTGFLDDQTLPSLKEAAVGLHVGEFWMSAVDTPASKALLDAFKKKFNRMPAAYAAAGYDSAVLLDAAIRRVNGNVSDQEAFRAALKEGADGSIRGKLRFNNNNFPIQSMYVFEAAKDGNDYAMKLTEAFPDQQDSYHQDCPLK